MNKSKSRDERIALETDREIAHWDPKSADFIELVLKDIERVPWNLESDDDCVVLNGLIALLEGDLDAVAKKRILCACDRSAGATRVVVLDKLIRVFHSQLVPREWKFNTLKKSLMDGRFYPAFGLAWIPTEFEEATEAAPEPFRLIRGCSFYRPNDAKFEALVSRLKELEKDSPGSVSMLEDRYGNTMVHYAFCQYWSTDDINGCEGGEYSGTGAWFVNALKDLGCDFNHENVFGMAHCDLRFDPKYG